MAGCPTPGDFCTKAECAALKREIAGLKADIQNVRMAIDRHARQAQSENGGAHPWSGSKPGAGKPGPPGKAGRDGKNGRDGKAGKNGKNGQDGKSGKDGKNGKDGKPGKDGKTPIRGIDYFDGADGRPGRDGKDGKPGVNGRDGKDGKPGLNGRDGRDGKDGAMGPRGFRGANGLPGTKGADGKPGLRGERGLPGAKGDKGDKGDPAKIEKCQIRLIWDANSGNLKAELTINSCNSQSTVKLDMKELIDLLKDIQGKVTVSAPIRSGECVEPETEGDWYLYQENQAQTLNGFNDIFAKLSEQIEGIHKDTCKAVQHKMELPELPPPVTCEINPETGEMQVQSMTTEQMSLIGLIPPWVFPNAGGAVVSWLTTRVLDWLLKTNQAQQKHTYELLCNKEETTDNPIFGCLPKIAPDLSQPNINLSTGITTYPPLIRNERRFSDGEAYWVRFPVYDDSGEKTFRIAYSGELENLVKEHIPVNYQGDFFQIPKNGELVPLDPDLFQKFLDSLGACDQEETASDCSVLLPDPSAVWNTEGYYIFFHWKLENPITKAEKEWRQKTQLTSPIDELINPSEPDKIWDEYFAGIYQILGNQWGEVVSANKARRYPLYKGWFADVEEGKRFFSSIEKLTTIPYRAQNNPSFPVKEGQSVRLVNQGKKIVLRKVCIVLKRPDTDKIDIVQGYAPKK